MAEQFADPAPFAVIFDMDGVLTETTRLHYESWRVLADELGLPFDAAHYDRMRGLAREASLRDFLGDAAKQFDAAAQTRIITRKQDLFLDLVEALTPADRLPGVTELIADLQRHRLPLAVGSASRNTDIVLRKIGLRDAFDALVDANTVAESKPSPAIFLAAAAALGFPPRDCVVIEDAAAGVAAARAAGMRVLGVGPVERLAAADQIVATLTDVKVETLAALHRR